VSRRPLLAASALWAFCVVLALPAPARAHQSSVSYSTVEIADTGDVRYTLLLSTRDLYEALRLDEDRDATDAEILAGRERLFAYVAERIAVADRADGCPLTLESLDVVTQNDRFARLVMQARCGAPIGVFVLDYVLFFDLDERHAAMLEVRHGDERVRRQLSIEVSRFEWDLAGVRPWSEGFVDFVGHGVEHIFGGYDHVAFLIALLLVSARARAREGLVAVLKIVTAFTVAHSITLIAAANGWISLPSRLVESAIAATIVYVAVENIVLEAPRWRWPLAFGFGLVHGLGFASVLEPLLPPGDIVLPLLAFNLGVELGQLAIVALAFPLLTVVATRSPRAYRRVVVVGGSALVGLFGMLWLIERTVGVMTISRVLS
jgi:hypothetical protein